MRQRHGDAVGHAVEFVQLVQQLVALARAFATEPALLLADEPTGSLDAENASQLADLLIDLNKEQGVAMVIVTHSIDLAARMDKVYRLHEGRLTPQKI